MIPKEGIWVHSRTGFPCRWTDSDMLAFGFGFSSSYSRPRHSMYSPFHFSLVMIILSVMEIVILTVSID